ncbi:MAG: sulfite exporter TauE/SafE family protein [Gemmatimonadaceae bacterium]
MTLLLGVLVASLIGSVHCAAMCGGFVCVYARAGAHAPRAGIEAHAAYNVGRLFSYLTLGLLAGAAGARIDGVARLASVERGAAIAAGTLMIAWALSLIATTVGVHLPQFGAPAWAKRKLGGVLLAMRDQPPAVQAAAIGLLTTLLPCGWLYTFVVTAGGTGSPVGGAAVMLVFWLGTVPLLVGVGVGARRLARPFARHLPVASAVVVLVLGALSVAGKLSPLGSSAHAASAHAVHVVP